MISAKADSAAACPLSSAGWELYKVFGPSVPKRVDPPPERPFVQMHRAPAAMCVGPSFVASALAGLAMQARSTKASLDSKGGRTKGLCVVL